MTCHRMQRASVSEWEVTTATAGANTPQEGRSLALTTIALEEEAGRQSGELLNGILADSMILYALYKKDHWLVSGPTFYQLHQLFDKHAREQDELIDLIAERVQTLSGLAVGDPRQAAELTTIERPPDGAEGVPEMLRRLLDAHGTVIQKVRDAIDVTAKSRDWGSNDLLASDVLRRNELQVWFVSAHLVSQPLTDNGGPRGQAIGTGGVSR